MNLQFFLCHQFTISTGSTSGSPLISSDLSCKLAETTSMIQQAQCLSESRPLNSTLLLHTTSNDEAPALRDRKLDCQHHGLHSKLRETTNICENRRSSGRRKRAQVRDNSKGWSECLRQPVASGQRAKVLLTSVMLTQRNVQTVPSAAPPCSHG